MRKLCFLLFLPALARAEEKTSSLSWVRMPGAESCVSTPALAKAVEERLRRSVFVSASQADLSVEGTIARLPGGFRATVTVRDNKGTTLGTRELDGAKCEAMTEPLALVIALMIDPDAESRPPPPPPPPPAPPPPQVIVETREVKVPVIVEPKPKPIWRFEGSAAFVSSVGYVPDSLGLGAGVFALLEPPDFITLEGGGVIFGEKGGLSTGYVAGGLCPLAHRGKLAHFFACLVSQLGAVRRPASDETKLQYAIGPEGRITIRIADPVVLRSGVTVAFPLLRERIGGFEAAPVVLTFDLGLGLSLP